MKLHHFLAVTLVLTPLRSGAFAGVVPEARDIPPADVVFVVANQGEIRVRLDPELAPNHCAQFLTLAATGAYRGCAIHRVIPGFILQAGEVPFAADSALTEVRPRLRLPKETGTPSARRGSVAMAWRGCTSGTAEREWFILLADLPEVKNCGTVIGQVVAGMDVVDRIAQSSTNAEARPLRPILFEDVRVVPRSTPMPPETRGVAPSPEESATSGED